MEFIWNVASRHVSFKVSSLGFSFKWYVVIKLLYG